MINPQVIFKKQTKMNGTTKILYLLSLLLLLSSCKTLINENELKNDNKDDTQENVIKEKSRIEVRFSCGEKGILEYTNDGWEILEEYSEEKICTWKSFAATKDCDMEKDKGCKITEPDKIGEERIYILEK